MAGTTSVLVYAFTVTDRTDILLRFNSEKDVQFLTLNQRIISNFS